MRYLRFAAPVLLLFLTLNPAYAGDREDIQGVISKQIASFNNQDYNAYFQFFASDYTAFTYVASTLRHDASAWRSFIEGTAALEHVNYHQQDERIQIYNGNTAVVTGYYTFTWQPRGESVNTQSGRSSNILVKQNGKWLTTHMHFSKMFD